jgi:hypothetical protein
MTWVTLARGRLGRLTEDIAEDPIESFTPLKAELDPSLFALVEETSMHVTWYI